jgi:hypothetical protein
MEIDMNDNDQMVLFDGVVGTVDWTVPSPFDSSKCKFVSFVDGTWSEISKDDDFDVLSKKEAKIFRLLNDIKDTLEKMRSREID